MSSYAITHLRQLEAASTHIIRKVAADSSIGWVRALAETIRSVPSARVSVVFVGQSRLLPRTSAFFGDSLLPTRR